MKIHPISLVAYGLISIGAALAEDKSEPAIAPTPAILTLLSHERVVLPVSAMNGQLAKDLNDFYHAAIKSSDSATSIESNAFSLVKLSQRDYQTFLAWYGEKVNNDTSNSDYHLLQQQLLETIGRQLIMGYTNTDLFPGDTTLEKGENLRPLLHHYIKVIEKNNHLHNFLANGLTVCDSIMIVPLRSIKYDEFKAYHSTGPIGDDLTEGILNLFEISLRGVKKLLENHPEEVGADLKKVILKVALDAESFGDHPDKNAVNEDGIAKAHARLVDSLVENYFGVEGNREDIEGLKLFIQSTASSFNIKDPRTEWSPSILLPVIDKSRAYFQSALSKYCAEVMERISQKGSDSNVPEDQEAIKIFQFFSSLDCIAQRYFHPFPIKRLVKYYPSIAPDLQERVGRFADKLVEPIGMAYIHPFDNLTLEVQENRGERNILDSAWRSCDDHNLRLVTMNETLAGEQIDVLKSRLAIEQNPYIRGALFRSMGIMASSNTNNETGEKAFKILETALMEETSYQSIRGIACGVIFAPEAKFVELLETIDSSKNKHLILQETLNDVHLTPSQRLIIKAMYLTDDYLSTLSHDMQDASKSKVIVKKTKDAHRQYSHNAFIFLAEFGSQLKYNPLISTFMSHSPYSDLESRFRAEISNHLTANLRMKILYVDTFMHPELHGESIDALLSLWDSYKYGPETEYDTGSLPKDFEEMVKDLGELFFGPDKPDRKNETFGIVDEPVMEAYRRYALRSAVKPGSHYDFILAGNTPLDQIKGIKNFPGYDNLHVKSGIQRLRIAEGIVKAAGDSQLLQDRQSLLKMASPCHKFSTEELLDPYIALEKNYSWRPSSN